MMERFVHPAPGGTDPQKDFFRQRARSTGITMVVMGVSFALYYLGLFGGVAGPLAPAKLGTTLAGLGVTRRHVLAGLLVLLILTGTWNWILNLAGRMTGSRLRCTGPGGAGRDACGETVRRERSVAKGGGRMRTCYVCPRGHRRPEARFLPVRKGPVSHALWVTALVFCLVTAFLESFF